MGGKDVEYQTAFMMPVQSDLNPELDRIWAYATIENLQSKMDYFGADQDTEDAITDLATKYGLVTDYPSMIGVCDEVVPAQGRHGTTHQRSRVERKARQTRSTQAPQNRRVDQNRPMYKTKRPSTGGGAVGLPMIVLVASMALYRRRKRNML